METRPAPLDTMSSADEGLDEFRVSSPREIALLLKQLADGSARLNLNASDGRVFTSAIWTLDSAKGMMSFNADAEDPALQALLACDEATVVGYLDNVKLQFEIDDFVLVQGQRASVLSCPFPDEMYRFQRRDAFRVRPLTRSLPVAHCRHPAGDGSLALRVLDVSIGGVGLLVPDGMALLQAGMLLRSVQIELDADTTLRAELRTKHTTPLKGDSAGARLGCEFVRPDNDTLRNLQRFIDQTQKRGRLMALT